jgi:hypothetical protein
MNAGTRLLEHKCWNTTAGTRMMEHECWNMTAGTRMLEHDCWNTNAGTQCWNTALHDEACVEEASKEPVQKIRDNAGMRKAKERMKERETTVGVEKSRKTFSLKLDWQLRQEEHSVA